MENPVTFYALAGVGAIALVLLIILATVGAYSLFLGYFHWAKTRKLGKAGYLLPKDAVHDWRVEKLEDGDYAVAPPDEPVQTEMGIRFRPAGVMIVEPEDIDAVYEQIKAHRKHKAEHESIATRLQDTEIFERIQKSNKEMT